MTKLTLRNDVNDRGDRMQFSWNRGDATSVGEFGDPTFDTQYTVCVWDYVARVPNLVMEMVAMPAGNCAGRPCWRSTGSGKTFRYKDFGLLPDGIQQMTLRSGVLGKTSVLVRALWRQGKGAADVYVSMSPTR